MMKTLRRRRGKRRRRRRCQQRRKRIFSRGERERERDDCE
jgi:hypothetical protein